MASTATDGDGAFRFEGVEPGAYTVVAVLDGFDTMSMPVTVSAGEVATLKADLHCVDVRARGGGRGNGVCADHRDDLVDGRSVEPGNRRSDGRRWPVVGPASARECHRSARGVSIKGGRPSRAATQLGAGALVDPSTGLSQVSLPDDAVETVTVLPNPYAVGTGDSRRDWC